MHKKTLAIVGGATAAAVAAAGVALARADISVSGDADAPVAAPAPAAAQGPSEAAERIQKLNRQESMPIEPPVRELPESQKSPDAAKAYAKRFMKAEYGWGADQYQALVALWTRESDWVYTATNPTSGAYGIPQSLPAEKMAAHGKDWRTNPRPQIRWGLEYIALTYGTPAGAWGFFQANNWY